MMSKITHVIVLMMENRSFDHMLGFLKSSAYPIDGLTGQEGNPIDLQPGSRVVLVSKGASDLLVNDPGHGISDVNVQLFSNVAGPPPPDDPNMGFIYSYGQQPHVTPAIAPQIMKCFSAQTLPVLSALAQEFAVCDHWYSAVPGPTWPNRFFAHCATSKGEISNTMMANYDMPTVFEQLEERGLTWGIYFHDVPQSVYLTRLNTPQNRANFHKYDVFKSDAAQGRLPSYSFIEPRYFFNGFVPANDQHPPHAVSDGERLIAEVVATVKSSPLWEQSLLIVLYDEHGGIYDHRTPPAAVAPDGHTPALLRASSPRPYCQGVPLSVCNPRQ